MAERTGSPRALERAKGAEFLAVAEILFVASFQTLRGNILYANCCTATEEENRQGQEQESAAALLSSSRQANQVDGGAVEHFLEKIRSGLPIKYAALAAGTHPDSVERWRATVPGLEEELDRAQAQAVEAAWGRIEQAGAGYKRSLRTGAVTHGV